MSEVKFRIVVRKPPAGVAFGLQLGKSAANTIVQTQQSAGKDLRFEFALSAVTGDGSCPPDFRGPAAQGRKGERFVYLCVGQYAGQVGSPWARRMKVPLVAISGELVELALGRPLSVLEAQVPGTARDGGPNAATVKPVEGWVFKTNS
jgi:hypothetical protein